MSATAETKGKKPRGRHGPAWDLGVRAQEMGLELVCTGEEDGKALYALRAKNGGFTLDQAEIVIELLTAHGFHIFAGDGRADYMICSQTKP